jgi:starch synthase (maltosyl-transferring)
MTPPQETERELLSPGRPQPHGELAERKQPLSLPDVVAFGPQLPRVVIENVKPQIDDGRYPVKRAINQRVEVTADVFTDGHDMLKAVVLYRHGDSGWLEAPLEPIGNDRWQASFLVTALGRYEYTVQAWVDRFGSWRRDLAKKADAGQDVSSDLLEGAALVEATADRFGKPDGGESAGEDTSADVAWLRRRAAEMRGSSKGGAPASPAAAHKGPAAAQTGPARAGQASESTSGSIDAALDSRLLATMNRYADRSGAVIYHRALAVTVDPERARFRAWYEMFPRSASREPGQHGAFRDVEKRLAYIAGMGFDVLYLPPIHPIGKTHRKGKNNARLAAPEDVGSPWAIGSEEGGHKAIHPQLGTVEDLKRLMRKAAEHGIEIALDLAYQASPDHPYAKEHPEWFRHRPDGTIKYAENPPKKYEDIYPIDFESAAGRELWEELKRVVLYWVEQGIRIFRVDNPHTKPFIFWEWMITDIKRDYPDVIFLSEAFTRPRVMYRLAKLGFTQSYTYFAWRNTKWELTSYMNELTQTEVREYFRPNLWPNTPDILTEYLQMGDRPAFMSRLVLAATLSSNYGIYGPAFELCENRAVAPGSEEYLDSEKYQVRSWDLNRPDSLKPFIARVNMIRREYPALQNDWSLRFHNVDNDEIIAYSKTAEDLSEVMLVVVNLDPHHAQSGLVELPLEAVGVEGHQPFQVHDLLNDVRYFWHGPRNFVELRPADAPARIFRLRRRLRTERDFDYYM